MRNAVIILAMAIATPATAAERDWVQIDYNDKARVWLDRSSVSAKGSIVTAWIDTEILEPKDDDFSEMFIKTEYDCAQLRRRELSFIAYYPGEDDPDSFDETTEWQAVNSGTIASSLLKAACSQAGLGG